MNNMNNDILVFISLTSIKSRYENKQLQQTLDRLLTLNYNNYIIVLNISKEPKYLDKGFTDIDIKWLSLTYPTIKINVVKNYGPLRKIIPTLKLYPNNIIITVDDDAIYNKNIISNFINIYNLYKCIVCGRSRKIKTNYMEKIINYELSNKNGLKMNLLPEGVGGVLYHSSMFDDKFINFDFNSIEDEFLRNDDLLLRAYTIVKKIPVYHMNNTYKSNGLYKPLQVIEKIFLGSKKNIKKNNNKLITTNIFYKIIDLIDLVPKIKAYLGLYGVYNYKYIINFKTYITKVKFIISS
jgi:hypothetical protein